MRKIASKEASRRFFSVLKDADNAPVIIEKRGKPRAAMVSIQRFRLYEKLIAYYAEETSIAMFEEAVAKVGEGHLHKGAQLRRTAKCIGQLGRGGRS